MRPCHFRCIYPYCSRARHCQIIAGLSAGRNIAAGLTLLKLCAPNLAAAQQSGLAAIIGPAACAENEIGVASYALASELWVQKVDPNIDIPPTHDVKSIGKVLYMILEGLYDALFGSRHNFEQAFHAEGGAQNSSAYREAEEATSAEKTHQEFACPFAGPEGVWELCRSSRIFKVRLCRFRLLNVSIGGFEALVLAQYNMKHGSLMPNPKYLRRRCSWRSARVTLKRLSASWLSASTLINFATRSPSVLLSFLTFFFA